MAAGRFGSNPGLARPGSIRPGFPGIPGMLPGFDVLPVLPPFTAGGQNDVRTEMLLGSLGWTDISQWVEEIADQQATRGKPDESTSNTPGGLTLTLNNADGRFFDGNPTGPYYGKLGRNTPLRISVPEGASYLRMRDDTTSYCATPSSSALNVPADIDVRLDLTLDNWRSAQQLAGKWGGGSGQQSWALTISQSGILTFWGSTTGSNTITLPGSVPVPIPAGRRQLIRATWSASTGVVNFYYGTGTLSVPGWTLFDTNTGPGGAVFASTQALVVGNAENGFLTGGSIGGKLHAFQLLKGIAGTVVASPDFTTATPGASSFTDAQGNTWTPAGTAVITNRHYRFWGETAAFPQSWNSRGTAVQVSLQVNGILRRLTQSASQNQTNSVLRRAFAGPANLLSNLVGYWPCEDGNSVFGSSASATPPPSFAPGIPGIPIGTYTGSPQFASNSDFQASLPLPALNNSTWFFSLPGNRGNDTVNVLRFLLEVPAAGEPATFVNNVTATTPLLDLHTKGTIAKLQVQLQGGTQPGGNSTPISTSLLFQGFNAAGSSLFQTTLVGNYIQGTQFWVSVELTTSGSAVQYAIGLQVIGQSYVLFTGTTTASASIGNATSIVVNPAATLTGTTVGHITYQGTYQDMTGAGTGIGEFSLPISAYIGETAGARFQRLCSEQGIPFRARGNLADTQAMGAQTTTDIMALLQECVDADRGMWWEPPWVLALGYRTLSDLLNQQPIGEMTYAGSILGLLLNSNEDDQFTVNDAQVVNSYTGGQAELAVTSGPLSNQSPPNGVGPYQAQPQINLAADWQAQDEAGWITWVGTAPDLRFPEIPFPMSRQGLATFFALQEADVGDRVQIDTSGTVTPNTAAPVWLQPSSETVERNGIDVLVNNLTTALNVKRYDIGITGVPTTPYLTAQADDPVHGRAGAAASSLAGPMSPTQTVMPVLTPTTSNGVPTDPWTTLGGDFPFDLGVGGEQVTATAINGNPASNDVGSDSANPPQIAVTPGVSGSIIYGAVYNPTNSTAFTADANTTFSQNVSDATNSKAYGTFRLTALSTGGAPVTLGASGPAVSGHIETAEIVAAGGTISEDASSPAVVNTTTAKTLTTASFSPPANTLLVAMIVANGSGPLIGIGDNSGSAQSWFLLASDGANNVNIWAKYIGASPPASMAVTTTWSGGGASNGGALTVKVLDNAAAGWGVQVFTVTRSQNGVVKSQAAGTPVDLFTVPVPSL